MARKKSISPEMWEERIKGIFSEGVVRYVNGIVSGDIAANKDRIAGCRRFIDMVESGKWDIRTHDADFVIGIIESTVRHRQGESLDGRPLRGELLKLEDWEKFIIYGMLIFFKPGTDERLVKEAFIFLPRKNGKTLLVSAIAWALALLEERSGSKVYVVGAAMKQALETFENWLYTLEHSCYESREEAKDNGWRIAHSFSEHSLKRSSAGESMELQALASSVDKQDSLNCNIVIADEIHAYRTPKQYNILKEATKAYTNKLVIGITTAGDDGNGFCAQRLSYCRKVVNGTVKDDQYFIFICCADPDENGTIDFTNAEVQKMANPNYGITIRPEDIMNDALQAQNDPQQRKDFLSKSLNVFVASQKGWFDIDEFRASNAMCEEKLGINPKWKLEKKLQFLAGLGIDWFGGADLSKLHDLTAATLHGQYKGIDIVIPHCWFPIVTATAKANEDAIPLFGWQDDGWLTMVNAPTNDAVQVVKWFCEMRDMGFKIKQVGHDRKFCREYFIEMKKQRFNIIDQPQYYYLKSEGFRHIENQAKNKALCYLGAEPYEYCVQNVSAVEKTDDMIQYEKVHPKRRIDVFDADVFATVRMLISSEKKARAAEWVGEKGGKQS